MRGLGTSRSTTHSKEILFADPLMSYGRTCKESQRVNKSKPIPTPMVVQEIVTTSFERVCVDLVGQLPKSNTLLLTYIDLASMWPDTVPMIPQPELS